MSDEPMPSWAWSQWRLPRSPEGSPCHRHPSIRRILGSLRRVGLQRGLWPWDSGESTILYPRSLREQAAKESTWAAETTELLGQDPFRPSSSARRQSWAPDLCAPSLPEESLPAESALTTGTQERVGLPGVLTEANRITGGTSSSQRQL